MAEYNPLELMICSAAKFLEDGAVVVVGTGAPCAAAMLAQKTTAPKLVVLFEAGGIAPLLPTMPISVGDSRTFHKGLQATSMDKIMEACQKGLVDYAFLGGAQIDKYGNLNSTIAGTDYYKPKVRFPGSGGANDLGSLCWKTIVMTPQDKRRFVEKMDFVTTPGFLTGPSAREEAGLPPHTGPYKVITNLAVMGYDEKTKLMQVESLHPGVTEKDVKDNTGFNIGFVSNLKVTPAPSAEALRILRTEVDPSGFIINRPAS
ncbi:MAG: 3-oxoacid CoA-transferase [Candidatus Firestonebacteria bacterium RIFOXYA2_FULL_40_8]|nr:MAG: 3-oxoacid CoA-transferase [Candidatus Firestonebacteria bacterium RIFOXYA2_FULL_40_8]